MEIRQLRCFMSVAEHLNFTKAASRVFITQSAISYQIAELEKQLDVKLFIRDKHSVRLTPAGEVFYQDVQRILAELDEAVDKVRMTKSGSLGKLSIGVLASEPFLPETINRFNIAHPNIAVTLNRFPIDALNTAMERGEVDIGITISVGLAEMPNYRVHVLAADVLSVVMRNDHPLAQRERLTVTDLKDQPMILINREASSVMSKWFEGFCAKRGFIPNVVRRTSDLETILFQIESGLGISCLSRARVALYPRFNLRCVDFEEPEMAINSVVVWRDNCDNPAVGLFLREMGIV
ncbi:LysR family transcriptional regulator [Holophaga foetida]|uniref:LysR family transcriptional regulator n=1 Tax=Holophaga foetida TaxID=35839 RepID=UPI0002472AFE|nr:LysR family transcriptional regulator [Holophaga foetida]